MLDFRDPEVAVGVPGLLIGGLALLFFRYETVLDRQYGTATQWWGFVRPFKSEVYSLDEFEFVSLEEPLTLTNPSHRFEIWLRGRSQALKLSGGRSHTQMQQWAQKIASHLKTDLRTPLDG